MIPCGLGMFRGGNEIFDKSKAGMFFLAPPVVEIQLRINALKSFHEIRYTYFEKKAYIYNIL